MSTPAAIDKQTRVSIGLFIVVLSAIMGNAVFLYQAFPTKELFAAKMDAVVERMGKIEQGLRGVPELRERIAVLEAEVERLKQISK